MSRADAARLAVWSGPRNISTALMRAWEVRDDSLVLDEPLYAHYLAVTGLAHPAREEVIAAGETDWRVVVRTLLAPAPDDVRVVYSKQMTHHLTPDVDRAWISTLTNVLLIRSPDEVVASYLRSRSEVDADDIGLRQQLTLWDELSAAGVPPMVIDAADFLRAPAAYLARMCELVGVAYTDAMLSWPPGPRDSDGVWAPHWYEAVWRSTGFEPYQPRSVTLASGPARVAEACRPAYEALRDQRWLPPAT